MTDFETVSVELPSGRSLEGQRETRHSVWLEGWELAETGDVVRIDGASWRVDDLHRARIGGQRATRLHVVRESDGADRVAQGARADGAGRERADAVRATGRDLERKLSSALGDVPGDADARYASELGALLRLTSHMERLGYRLSYTRPGDAPIAARVETMDGSGKSLEETGATVADALCRVSLAALEQWERSGSDDDVRPPPRPRSRRPERKGSARSSAGNQLGEE